MNAWAWAVLVVSLAVLGWTYAGYPLAMRCRARWLPRPAARSRLRPHVTVCIAAHEAAAAAEAKVRHLMAHDYPADRLDVVLVDDGSGDDTVARLRALQGPRFRLIEGHRRRGKSACLADAVRAARGEVLVFTDVRQTLAPGSVAALCEALGDAGYRAVGGVLRFVDAQGYARDVDAYWRYESALRAAEAATGSVVGVSGALYAVRRDDMPVPPPGLILDDLWVPMRIAESGGRVGLEPGAVAFDVPSPSAAVESARKRRTLAGNWQLLARHPRWLLPWAHPLAWRFWQHKVLRLLGPLPMLGALLASAWLAPHDPVALGLLLGQLAAYLLAVAGLASAVARRLLPIRLCATFLEMNLYAVRGFIDFLRQRDLHLWRAAPVPFPSTRPS